MSTCTQGSSCLILPFVTSTLDAMKEAAHACTETFTVFLASSWSLCLGVCTALLVLLCAAHAWRRAARRAARQALEQDCAYQQEYLRRHWKGILESDGWAQCKHDTELRSQRNFFLMQIADALTHEPLRVDANKEGEALIDCISFEAVPAGAEVFVLNACTGYPLTRASLAWLLQRGDDMHPITRTPLRAPRKFLVTCVS